MREVDIVATVGLISALLAVISRENQFSQFVPPL